jgi:tRNA-specific adenosine deaminase 1
MQSLPSISMSCTDKMAMWSAVGMQGSVLSRWLEPIFFDRLIVGIDSIGGGASPSTVKEAIQDCQRILHSKLGQDDSIASRPLKVEATSLPFVHSKEKVQARLSATSADFHDPDLKGEEAIVTAAGCECIVKAGCRC